MSAAPQLSISIVVYQPDLEVLARALRALRVALTRCDAVLGVRSKLFVIDNSCATEWLERVRRTVDAEMAGAASTDCELVASEANLGYGYGNNRVLARIAPGVHVVMNPDIFVEADSLVRALRCMDAQPRLGLLLADVRGEDGERHYLCKRSPTLFDMFLRGFAPSWLRALFRRRMGAFEMRERDYDRPIEGVSYPTGCFMVFRSALLERLGGFDERFFMYLEDADIGRRMLQIAAVTYVPEVRVVHKWARGTHRSWKLRWATVESAVRYWRKWGGVV